MRQRERGLERKVQLVALHGGCCARCGYGRNYAALEFHHADPESKRFQLDMRALANLSWELIIQEASKCALLCSNCHAEHHNPAFERNAVETNLGSMASRPKANSNRA